MGCHAVSSKWLQEIIVAEKRVTLTFASQRTFEAISFKLTNIDNQPTMKYQIDKQEHYAILSLNEENLNSTIAPQLKSDLILLSQEGIRNFILDLSNVKYVDSSGLSAILTGHRLWKGTGTFVLAGEMHPMVTKLIEISRLETILTIIPTISESIDFVMMEELERQIAGE